LKEFGLIRPDASIDDAEILEAPRMIPFDGVPSQTEGKDLKFDDIL
jgi:hypothetical protein